MRLIIAGGGTGGHLFPGIAVAEEFLSRDPANQVLFVGSSQGIEARTIPRLGYQLELISAAGIKGKGSLAKLVNLLTAPEASYDELLVKGSTLEDVFLKLTGRKLAEVGQ